MTTPSAQQVAHEEIRAFFEEWRPTCEHEIRELRQEGGALVCIDCERPLVRRRSSR
jgi:hypothetical protein